MEPPAKKQRGLAEATVANTKGEDSRAEDASVIFFPKHDVQKTSYKLFEVPKNLMKSLDGGLRLVGDDTNHVVLCTESKTYAVKKVETTNSVFLVSPSESTRFNIKSLHHDYYELSQIVPSTEAVENLLKPSVYISAENDSNNSHLKKNLLTLSDLESLVQASPCELQQILKKLGTVDIDGYIRIVDRDSIKATYKLLFDTVMEKGWDAEKIPHHECFEELVSGSDVDSFILRYVLQSIGRQNNDMSWTLETTLVAKKTAQIAFEKHVKKTGSSRIAVDDFLLEWAMATPCTSSCPNVDLLEGIAIREDTAEPDNEVTSSRKVTYPCYLYLNLEDLPSNPEKRFEFLFNARRRYTHDELLPYISELYGGFGQPKDAPSLLLLFTKLVDGYYCKK